MMAVLSLSLLSPSRLPCQSFVNAIPTTTVTAEFAASVTSDVLMLCFLSCLDCDSVLLLDRPERTLRYTL